ncbi:hypothetical protein ACJMK2_017070 [Sinanodonta woodiana]|uniref:Superoxide dismutase [Cu-Zn] n=1 Tax=Sinanodonta woodiana TaxID=1069815 RepID=A0ABD3UVR4_SINWO
MKLSCILLFVTLVCVALARRPKKPGKPSSKDDLQDEIEELRQDLKELQEQIATTPAKNSGTPEDVQVGKVHIHMHGKDDHMMSSEDDPNDTHIHLHMHVDGCPGHDHHDDHHQHRHQHRPSSVNTSTNGSLDKYVFENDPDEIHAHCDFIANIGLPAAERENPRGYVHFSQKLNGGPVEVDVHVDGFNVHDSPGGIHQHAMHVHEGSDPENGCDHLRGHFNPHHTFHGGRSATERHTGDLGNIPVDHRGNVHTEFEDSGISLIDPNSIIGRSVVIHSMPDDLGMGTGDSKKHGNAGTRVACCGIKKVSGDVIDDVADGHDHDD